MLSVIARSLLLTRLFSVPAGAALMLTLAWPGAVLAAPQKLIALGDSLTQGYGLPEGDGFVPQLEAWLREKGRDIHVVNAGVSGDTTQGGLSRLDWTLSEPADALIVILGGNDLLRGLPPALTRSNLSAILSGAQKKDLAVMLVAMEAPGNYGPDYRSAFDAIYPELAAEHGVLLGESFLKPLVRGETNLSVMREFMQSDGIHPTREGVAKIVAAMGPRVIELLDQAAAR